jgi:hypothetical protein
MSWSIYATGTRQSVLAHVQGIETATNKEQFERAKQFIVCEIEALPEGKNGVEVKASGHEDSGSSYASPNSNLSIEVKNIGLILGCVDVKKLNCSTR